MFIASKMLTILKKSDDLFFNAPKQGVTKAQLQEVFTDNIEFHMPYGMPKLIGIDMVQKRCLIEAGLFEHFEFDTKPPIIAANRAATYATATVKSVKNDEIMGFEAIEISEFNDDYKIFKKTFYLDLEALTHALDKETLAHLFSVE